MVSQSLYRQLGSPESDRELLARFVASGDDDAFAVLVDRHGPLVRSVCARVLGDAHATDDAFQATFLLLARKAGSLANADAVSSWLFGVARRVSLAARRVHRRRGMPLHPEIDPPAPEGRGDWDDLIGVLEEELARLPRDLQAPLIACYLEGQTQDEAARSLGWSLSTLRRRLDEGRELLRSRLGTRGASLPAGAFVGGLVPGFQVAVPASLHSAALTLATGGTVPASVAVLVAATSGANWLVKGLLLVSSLALLAGLAYGASILLTPAPGPETIDERTPVIVANGWNEPLPPNAVARLGTTAFRHGTDGMVGQTPRRGIQAVQFQADGTLVSAGGQQVRFWDPASGEELHRAEPIATYRQQLHHAHLFDDGRGYFLPAGPEAGQPGSAFAVWNLTERRLLRRITFTPHPDAKTQFLGPTAVAPGAVAFAQQDPFSPACFWDATGKPRGQLAEACPVGTPLYLLADGKTALTVEGGLRVRLWDIDTGKVTRTFGGGLTSPVATALSADGAWLATLGHTRDRKPDAIVRLWQIASGTLVRELPWPALPAAPPGNPRLAFSSDGSTLVGVTPSDDLLHFGRWNLPDGESLAWQTAARGSMPRGLAVDGVRQRVAVAAEGVVRLFDTTSGKEFVPADAHACPIQSVRFTGDGDGVVSVDESGELRTWTAGGQPLTCEQIKITPTRGPHFVLEQAVILNLGQPDERRIALDVWKVMGLPMDRPVPYHPRALAESADGKYLALAFAVTPPTAQELGRVVVFDLHRAAVLSQTPIRECVPEAVCFSPDGQRLAVGAASVLLLNAATGATVATFTGHRGPATALAFRPDGRRLASGGTDCTILLWDCSR